MPLLMLISPLATHHHHDVIIIRDIMIFIQKMLCHGDTRHYAAALMPLDYCHGRCLCRLCRCLRRHQRFHALRFSPLPLPPPPAFDFLRHHAITPSMNVTHTTPPLSIARMRRHLLSLLPPDFRYAAPDIFATMMPPRYYFFAFQHATAAFSPIRCFRFRFFALIMLIYHGHVMRAITPTAHASFRH